MTEKLNGEDMVLWFDDLGTGNAEYNFLSNFYEGGPFVLPGITWENLFKACKAPLPGADAFDELTGPVEFRTGEHAFAAMKFWSTDWSHFYDIVLAGGPGGAKSMGRSRSHPLRPDWEDVKYDVMYAVVRTKFSHSREEGQWLLDTGDRLLVEGTWWHDSVWGVDLEHSHLKGRNWLGSMLMTRRAELRAEQMFPESARVTYFVHTTGRWNAEFAS